ncbi:SMP-30/gluconolactonase/LRE family protein [Microbispora bryophytorum]|uniref:SMP-30/gluconolactonase/LRE family protein n=1 Tax=Microbispora bryophytorum TaxID=1460882 RepID=UPI0033E0E8D6
MTSPELLVDAGLELGEGARWLGDRWVVVDIFDGALYEVSAGPGASLTPLLRTGGAPLGAVSPLLDRPGHWLAAVGEGVAVLGPDGTAHWLARPEAGKSVRCRMNDGAVDPAGRFWAGSMAYDGTPGAGSLYRVDPDGTVVTALTGVTVANGPAFSPDGTRLYLADSARGVISAYPLDPRTGALGAPEPLIRLDGGSPDGMTVDDEGFVWTAVWGESRVLRISPYGEVDRVVHLPCRQPSSVAIGGEDGTRLLVTSARYGLADPAPADGALWTCDAGVTAPPARAAVLTRYPE